MIHFVQDIRHAARRLRRSPALTLIAVVALALGIGMTTTMFSIIYGAVLRGLPFEESERIVHLEENHLARDIESMEVPIHDFHAFRESQTVFDGLAAFYTGTVNLSGTERAERYDGAFMTANAFDVLRVRPLLGRVFRPDEEGAGAPQVVVLSYGLWRDRFDSDPDVIGTTIRANGEPGTVIGVMPEGFSFPFVQDVWLPLRLDPLREPRGQEGLTLEVFGRLAPGVSLDRAAAHMSQLAERLALEHPQTNEGVSTVVKPYVDEYIGQEEQALLFTMLGAVFFVLLIACANVANLLVGRAIVRSRELAVRAAIGASRGRILLGFLAEPLVLAVAGAVLGIGIAAASIRAFNAAIAGTQPPFWIDIRLDLPALGFVLGATLLTALVSGVLPAWQASRPQLAEVLKDDSRGASSFRLGRLSRGLVVLEVALSFGLLVAAGLMIRSIANLRDVDLGFDTERVFTARAGLFEAEFPDSTDVVGFHDAVLERVRSLPGVEAAALSTSLPGLFSGRTRIALEGEAYTREQDMPLARIGIVSPGLLETLDARLVEGRDFNTQDRGDGLPVALVNQPFAAKHFAGQSALGRRFRVDAPEGEPRWLTVVGVTPDLHASGLQGDEPEAFYVPIAQSAPRFVSILARTGRDPASITAEVREAVASVDADVPIYWARTLQAAIDESNWFYRVFGTMFMIMGAAALFLSAVGLYGVTAFSVSRRTREVGIRMALGAHRGDVLRLIFRQGFLQLGVGIALGLLLALGLSQLLQTVLFGVEPRDPAILVSIALLLLGTGAAAFLVPARRATAVDPMTALRYE